MIGTPTRADDTTGRPAAEPLAARIPPRLPHPGPKLPDTYTPTTVQVIAAPNDDGSIPRPTPAIDAWLAQAFEGMARMNRDPAYAAYIASRVS